MQIHKKFDNKEDYKEFVEEILSWKEYEKSLWNEEDYPKLKPFFDYSNKARGKSLEMTQEEKESCDFYLKCSEDYANHRKELRDSVSDIDLYSLLNSFNYDLIDDYDDDDTLEEYVYRDDLNFPLIVTGYLDSSWDRIGKSSVCVIRFVELQEFKD